MCQSLNKMLLKSTFNLHTYHRKYYIYSTDEEVRLRIKVC